MSGKGIPGKSLGKQKSRMPGLFPGSALLQLHQIRWLKNWGAACTGKSMLGMAAGPPSQMGYTTAWAGEITYNSIQNFQPDPGSSVYRTPVLLLTTPGPMPAEVSEQGAENL